MEILKASPEKLWSALTNRYELSKWWSEGVILEKRIGGKFYEPWGKNQLATGKVLDFSSEKFIEFTWQEKYWKPEQSTVCVFSLQKQSSGVNLQVRHQGWETFRDPQSRAQIVQGFEKGWDSLLLKLQKHLENSNI